ncbi:MAG: hypothetical protein K6G88_02960 [Lachnospiraceae bacterium]|nr:hypothetical protein [Lachnospiraceae bacterium]
MKRKLMVFISLVMIICLCSFVPPDNPISPNYLYTYSCSSSLSISGSTATCTSNLTGYPGVTTKIVVKQILQVKDGNLWRTAHSWTKTYYSNSCSYVNTRTIYSGNTYRVKSEYTVYAGSNYETVYSYSSSYTT